MVRSSGNVSPSAANVAAKKNMAAEPKKQADFLKTISGHTKKLVENTAIQGGKTTACFGA
jgi:hypothetical protein